MRIPSPMSIAFLLLASCSSSDPQGRPKTSTSKVAYFDVGQCWAPDPHDQLFRGAVGVYASGGANQLVLFSGICKAGPKYDDVEKAFRVRLRCITGISGHDLCQASNARVELDEQIFDPGVRPEFPKAMYAVEGRLSHTFTRADDALVFDSLDVSHSQALPREVFAAFLFYPADRPGYIDTYLRSRALTKDGYKVVM